MKPYVGFISFVVGVGIGSASTWFIVKKKYEDIADKEIEDVKKSYSSLHKKDASTKDLESEGEFEVKSSIAESKLDVSEYVSYASMYKPQNERQEAEMIDEDEEDASEHEALEFISPDLFGMDSDYEEYHCLLFADDILYDEDSGMIITEPCEVLGPEYEAHLGEYIANMLHLKNNIKMAYYEVVVDDRQSFDVISN